MEKEDIDGRRSVFVVHGRNNEARKAVFEFLRSVGLRPMEWSQAVAMTGSGAPFIGEVLDAAFGAAQAVVVLLTPDDVTYLRPEFGDGDNDPEIMPAPQARPNVLFEAGMAFGRHPERTILVELGKVRPFSDVAGRHAVRISDTAEARRELAQRLTTAGCDVDISGSDWLSAGVFTPPPAPGGELPLGRRLVDPPDPGVRMTARHSDRGSGNGTLQITNHSRVPVCNLTIDVPEEAEPGFWLHSEPVKRLPAGETASFITARSMGGGADHFEIAIRGEREDGTPIETSAFVNLLG